MGGNADGDAGLFISPALLIQCDYIAGEKQPPPTVPLVQNNGTLGSAEQSESCNCPVCQGGGEEFPMNGVRRHMGECRYGLPGLWKTP